MNEAIRAFAEELASAPDTLAVILFGSQARGDARADSDADLLVIVPEGFRRAVERRGDQAFELIYLSEEVALGYQASRPDTAADVWAGARILYDPQGAAGRLESAGRRLVETGKPALGEAELESSRFNSEDQLRAAEALAARDPTAARLALHHKVLELTASWFDVRQRWTPPPKRRAEALAAEAPALSGLLAQFYADGSPLVRQLELARAMVPLVYEA